MKDVKDIYYAPYDAYVDIETGIFLDICTCDEKDKCTFKQAWIDDGRPERLNRKELMEIIFKEGEDMIRNMK